MFVQVWQVRDTGALLSPSHGTGEYQPRREHDCWGGVLRDKASCGSSAMLAIWPPRTQTAKLFFAFLLLNTTKAQTKLRKPQQYLLAASTAEQPSNGSAHSSKVHTVHFHVAQSATTQAPSNKKNAYYNIYEVYIYIYIFIPSHLLSSPFYSLS